MEVSISHSLFLFQPVLTPYCLYASMTRSAFLADLAIYTMYMYMLVWLADVLGKGGGKRVYVHENTAGSSETGYMHVHVHVNSKIFNKHK